MRPHASRRRLRRLLSMRASVGGGILASQPAARTCTNQPTAVGNNRRLRSIVSGLLFTMNGATRTCDMGLRRSSETRAPRRETLARRSEAEPGEGQLLATRIALKAADAALLPLTRLAASRLGTLSPLRGEREKSVPCLRAYHVYRTVPVPA